MTVHACCRRACACCSMAGGLLLNVCVATPILGLILSTITKRARESIRRSETSQHLIGQGGLSSGDVDSLDVTSQARRLANMAISGREERGHF